MTSGYYWTSKDTHPHGGTPDHILDALTAIHGEMFDPCPNKPTFDGLEIEWPFDQVVYVNPPYTRGQIGKWVKRCHDHWVAGGEVIMLIPSYTDTRYFHDFIYKKATLDFIKGRLRFKGYDGPASFPSMLVHFERCV